MRFQIYSRETMIGQSNLDQLDPPMGIASGKFVPSADYKDVQPVFRLYVEATTNASGQASEMLKRYYQEQDRLQLTVRLPDGEGVPVQWVHIEDFSAELGEIQATVVASDGETFSHYFEA